MQGQKDTTLAQRALDDHGRRALRIIDGYWHRLARQGSVPRRDQIDPQQIADALEFAFIADRIAEGHARMRVAGGAVSGVMGMDVAGMPLAMMLRPDARDVFAAHLATVFSEASKLSMSLRAPARFGQSVLEARLVLYPLRDAQGRVTKALGALVTTGPTGRPPRRFGIVSVEMAPFADLDSGMSRQQTQYGHLRLVVSNA